MAVTKTHPIKSTLKAAIDYILNPEKTDGKLLASSFGCGLETADIEFAWTREAAGDRGTHLGRHLIQSFAVGETTPEEAHKIGMELAGAVLGGKYEFVLTTHVDKDHLHNHLIFNAVSFVDYKKYHSNKQSYHFIRRTSDRICKEHGLSVVVPGQDKGKSYAEYTAEKQGTSYKAKLKTAIDTLIPQVKDFDELLRRLQEMGYEIKQGKYISFRAAGQERFTRTKTLGAAYTEEAIKERIKGVYELDKNSSFPLCIRLIDCCVILGLMVMDDGFDREPCKQRIPLRKQQRVPEPPDATIPICEWMNHLKFIVKHAAFDQDGE